MLYASWSRQQLISAFPPKLKSFNTTASIQPDFSSSLLSLCRSPRELQQVHARFILLGFHHNLTISSQIIDAYANLGLLTLSRQVFRSITDPNAAICAAYLRMLCKFGHHKDTLLVYQEMVRNPLYPDELTYPFVLRSCSALPDVKSGRIIHGYLVKSGFDSFESVGSALVDMYRGFDEKPVHEPFDEKPVNRVSSWNLSILQACHSGNFKECFWFFKRMTAESVEPGPVTLINLLKATVGLSSLTLGKCVHGLVVVGSLCDELSVSTALLTMYSKLGGLNEARCLFERMHERDSVVWNLIISAYTRKGFQVEPLVLLTQMVRAGVRPDFFTALAAVSAIAELKNLKLGKEIHAHVIRNGSDYQVSIHNALIDMYCKCNCLIVARKIFDLLTEKTIVSWSSIIKGYVSHDQCCDALSLFSEMKLDGFKVDYITVINTLPGCVKIGALEQVKYLHGYSIKIGFDSIVSLNTAFLVSYAKCGCIEMAQKIFDDEEIDSKDIVIWNSMISAYSKHGDWFQCFELYYQMKQSEMIPDHVTFLALLTACVNSGSVKQGRECFKEMTEKYGCQPNQQHYACMVDLLGRAGHIKEASEIIKSMPLKPDAGVWGPLLSACKMHSDPGTAEFAAERLISIEPKNAGNYILLSNIYAAAGKWDGVAKMRTFLRDNRLKKTPGCSWLELNGQIHEFRVAEQSHPKSLEIYTTLGSIDLEINKLRHARLEKQL